MQRVLRKSWRGKETAPEVLSPSPKKLVVVLVLVLERKAEYDDENEDERFSFNAAPQRGMAGSLP
jgi:hypothetical protein